MSKPIPGAFDYGLLDVETQAFVQEKTLLIHARLKRTAEDIVCIGTDLLAVKRRLGEANNGKRGLFMEWIAAEFEMSQAAANKFMQVATHFGEIFINFTNISVSVLYELAAPSMPATIVEQVQRGEIEPTLGAI